MCDDGFVRSDATDCTAQDDCRAFNGRGPAHHWLLPAQRHACCIGWVFCETKMQGICLWCDARTCAVDGTCSHATGTATVCTACDAGTFCMTRSATRAATRSTRVSCDAAQCRRVPTGLSRTAVGVSPLRPSHIARRRPPPVHGVHVLPPPGGRRDGCVACDAGHYLRDKECHSCGDAFDACLVRRDAVLSCADGFVLKGGACAAVSDIAPCTAASASRARRARSGTARRATGRVRCTRCLVGHPRRRGEAGS